MWGVNWGSYIHSSSMNCYNAVTLGLDVWFFSLPVTWIYPLMWFSQSSIIASETVAIVSISMENPCASYSPWLYFCMLFLLRPFESCYNNTLLFVKGSSFGAIAFCNRQHLMPFLFHLPADTDSLIEKSTKMDGAETLPRRQFLYEDASNCSPTDGYLACSAVIPSLPLTIKWLRHCVRENPSLRLQVIFLS